MQKFDVKRRNDRFILVSPETGEVLDDAQGYGYTSAEKARKAGWYKFGGGQQKMKATKAEAEAFWRKNKPFARRVSDYYETWFKEIAIGEISDAEQDAAIAAIAQELGVQGYEKRFLKHLQF